MVNFEFSEEVLGLVSPPHFAYDFLRKIFLVFTSWHISQYVYCICLLARLRRQVATSQILKLTYLSIQALLRHDQRVKTKI